MATSAPAVTPSTSTTPAVPPPTTIEPLPQVISDSSRRNSRRYRRNAMGIARKACTKKVTIWPKRANGLAAVSTV
ncbi:Uncharacterised protein [Mycobacteroides abscessus subsp. abscessus]|nr:Uncharacterised protein [Mycobacteroides abscessus subsp. abscessus]